MGDGLKIMICSLVSRLSYGQLKLFFFNGETHFSLARKRLGNYSGFRMEAFDLASNFRFKPSDVKMKPHKSSNTPRQADMQ